MNAPAPTTAAPNWAEITTEPHCPLCEYMLRGLTWPRCPECGYTFDWQEVLDVSRREHPYLFEHHPERNIWSYCKTVIGALRPRRFWSQLHPGQSGSTRRLLWYWFIGMMILIATTLLLPIPSTIVFTWLIRQTPPFRHAGANWPPLWEHILDNLISNYSQIRFLEHIAIQCFIAGIWPWLTLGTLQIFWFSMRKARVRPVHVLRCVLYSMDGGSQSILLTLHHLVMMTIYIAIMHLNVPQRLLFPNELLLGVIGLALLFYTYRLATAYRHYLRFPHARSVAFASQIIVFLVATIVLVTLKLI